MMSLLLKNISRYVMLTAEEQEIVLSLVEKAEYKPRTLILKENEICRHSFFVVKGILRSYSVDKNGVEHIVSFASSGWWIADMYSLLSQLPSHLFIEANEQSEVLLLSKTNQEKLYEKVPKMERFFRILIEKSLVAHQQRILDNLSLSAEERYENFRKRHKDAVNSLPQKQIASYIGVTPEFFSKMKAQMLRK